jgi:hypothetical protein
MARNDDAFMSGFASPCIVAEAAAADQPGAMVLRSAEPLGGYPVTVMHSLREQPLADRVGRC